MSSTYSPDLRIELIGTGDQAGVWGATTNNNLAYVIEQSVAGYISVAVASANQAFTYINGGSPTAADNQAVHASLALTTSTGANFAVYAPPASKQYTIYNASSYTATIYNSTVIGNTTAAGTGVAIPAGKTMTVWSDGTNFSQQNTHLISPTIASPTLTTPALGTPTSGTMTNVTGLPLTTGVTGTLPVANGGTGVTTSTGSGNTVLSTSPTLVTPVLGTPTSVTLTNATGLPLTTGVTGTLPVANGGTGATSITSGSLVKGNGTSAFSAASASDIVTAIGSTAVANATSATTATSATSATSATTATKLATTTGSAPVYGVRAWANANSSGSLRNSGNIASCSLSGSQYSFTFSTAMADANYAIVGSCTNAIGNDTGFLMLVSQSTTGFTVQPRNDDGGANVADIVNVVVVG